MWLKLLTYFEIMLSLTQQILISFYLRNNFSNTFPIILLFLLITFIFIFFNIRIILCSHYSVGIIENILIASEISYLGPLIEKDMKQADIVTLIKKNFEMKIANSLFCFIIVLINIFKINKYVQIS